MATKDEILGGSPQATQGNTKESPETGNEKSLMPRTTPQPDVKGYEDLLDYWVEKPKTKEEMAAEEKKYKRQQLFNAIGDGLSALSNLYFTTQGAPNMYNGNNTMSERARVRYDKLVKDNRDNAWRYTQAKMKARQADAENAHRERSWHRQLGLDQEARDRYNENIQHRNEREAIADERYNKEQEESKRRWQTDFDENKRRADRSYNFNVQQHKDNIEVRKKQVQTTAAKGVRGKQLGFADGNGNQVSIYENVWKGSMQGIYDTLVADGIEPTELQQSEGMSAKDKDDFVKQNWYKSEKAKAQMLALSKLDPATMTSEVGNDSDKGLGWGNSDENNNDTDW